MRLRVGFYQVIDNSNINEKKNYASVFDLQKIKAKNAKNAAKKHRRQCTNGVQSQCKSSAVLIESKQ